MTDTPITTTFLLSLSPLSLRDATSRQPTQDEQAMFGREGDGCDIVFVLPHAHDHTQANFADAMEQAGLCDTAHVIPGVGVYLEE